MCANADLSCGLMTFAVSYRSWVVIDCDTEPTSDAEPRALLEPLVELFLDCIEAFLLSDI